MASTPNIYYTPQAENGAKPHKVNTLLGETWRPTNLEYLTPSQDKLHFHRTLRAKRPPTRRWPRPLRISEVEEIRRLRARGVKLKLLAAMFRTSKTKVCDAIAGRFLGVAP